MGFITGSTEIAYNFLKVEENTGRNSEMNNSKKDLGTFDFGSNNESSNRQNWLPGQDYVDNRLHRIFIEIPL